MKDLIQIVRGGRDSRARHHQREAIMHSNSTRPIRAGFPLAIVLLCGLWLASASVVGCSNEPDADSSADNTAVKSSGDANDKQLVLVESEEGQQPYREEVEFPKDEPPVEDPTQQPKIMDNAVDDRNADPTDQPNKDSVESPDPRKGNVSNVGLGGGGGGGGSKGGSGGSTFRRARGGGGRAAPPAPTPAANPYGGVPSREAAKKQQNDADDGRADGEAGDEAPAEETISIEEAAMRDAQATTKRAMEAQTGELWARPIIREGKLIQPGQAFPLKATDVRASISGFIAQTSVTQTYENSFDNPIEAIYVFPLPEDAAVNGYTMTIGARVIVGLIRKREEAKAIYEDAKAKGYRAALLEQERPNIFTQSIANIAPKEQIKVELTFMNKLKRKGGTYSWHFPMTVGSRYTEATPDAERITSPTLAKGLRSGNDVSLSVELDAGLPIHAVRVPSKHDYQEQVLGASQRLITLAAHETIPNKDFALEFDVLGDEMRTGYAAHASNGEGFVSLMIAPPQAPGAGMISPREIILLIDTSGSMHGEPLEIAKTLALKLIDGMRPGDTFNVMTYSGSSTQLWDTPKYIDDTNRKEAADYIEVLSGSGGTRMNQAIVDLLQQERDGNRMRMVAFFTDGRVGNESTVLSTLKTRKDDSTRIFAFGTGSSVNRFLLEKIGQHGGGHTEILMQNDYAESEKAVTELYTYMETPIFTHIQLDWSGVGEVETYPSQIRDVFAGIPVSITGRYDASAGPITGTLTLSGYLGGQPYSMEMQVDLPANEPANPGLAALWAREKIESLTDACYGNTDPKAVVAMKEQVVETALAYSIVSEGTSFVAVDEFGGQVGDGDPDTIVQPKELPEGTENPRTPEAGEPGVGPGPRRGE